MLNNYFNIYNKNEESYKGSLEPMTLDDVTVPTDHNGYIYVVCGSTLKIFAVKALCKYLKYNEGSNILNPLTRQAFKEEEIIYFRFHERLYDLSIQENLSKIDLNIVYETLVNFFSSESGSIDDKWKSYLNSDISKYSGYLKIENFSPHFKDFKYDENFA